MRGTSDCARYVTDICRALGWVHPIQIIKLAIDGPDRFTNPLAQIYVWAQQWRAKSLGAFLGVCSAICSTPLRSERPGGSSSASWFWITPIAPIITTTKASFRP